MPVKMVRTSRITAPSVIASTALPNVMPKPSVAPIRKLASELSIPKRCTAMVNQWYRCLSGTRLSAKSSCCVAKPSCGVVSIGGLHLFLSSD
jgi:hypothetical protein